MAAKLTLLCAVTWSAFAHAQAPADSEADAQFKRGKALLAEGKTAEACAAFDTSQKLEPSVSTSVNQANCREKNGQFATALSLFQEAERQTRAATDEATKSLHAVVRDRMSKLEPRVSKLTINVPAPNQIAGLTVIRDTTPIERSLWDREVPVDGGTYTIVATAPGVTAWSTSVTLSLSGDHKSVEIPDLRTAAPAKPAAPATGNTAPTTTTTAPTDQVDAPSGSTSGGRSLGLPLAVGGLGLAMLGVGLGFELSGRGTYDDAKAEQVDQMHRDSLYDSANSKHHIAQGLAVAGLATTGVAVWLFLRSGNTSSTDAPTTSRRFVISPTGVALIGQF